MSAKASLIPEQFETHAQEREAATLGMWVFLATEILFFGAMFLGYAVYRYWYPEVFMEAGKHTLLLVGSINTAVLLVSSFTMAVAVHMAEKHKRLETFLLLVLTAFLGAVFLCLKGYEYHHEIKEGLLPGTGFHIEGTNRNIAEMFYYLYFLMTGVHALHLTIGVSLALLVSVRVLITGQPRRMATTVDLLGLYWHFVDLVWVFLFPLFYLLGRHK